MSLINGREICLMNQIEIYLKIHMYLCVVAVLVSDGSALEAAGSTGPRSSTANPAMGIWSFQIQQAANTHRAPGRRGTDRKARSETDMCVRGADADQVMCRCQTGCWAAMSLTAHSISGSGRAASSMWYNCLCFWAVFHRLGA